MNTSAADRLLALRELPDLLPRRRGKRINLATLYRWVGRGVRRGQGRVRLPALRVGGVLYVDPADLARFLQALSSSDPVMTAEPVTPAARLTHDLAERRAEQLGI